MGTTPCRVAFAGLGAMGRPMAARLAGDERFEVIAYDVSPDALAAAAEFTTTADTLAEAARGADVVCSMLPSDRHVRALAAELAELGTPGQVFVDFSTISPGAMTEVGGLLSARGIRSVSASCMKSVAAARTGELSLFVGGEPDEVAGLGPLFGRLATDSRSVGSLGAAKTMKIANNLITATTGYCLLDGLVLAHALGCPADEAAAALRASGADSWVLRNQVIGHALADKLGPGIFSVRYMAKDVQLAMDLARSVGRPALFGALVLAGYRGLIGMGLGEAYHPSVVRWLERAAGSGPVTTRPEPAVPAAELAALWPGLRAVQHVVLGEVLDIAAASGIERRNAAELLQAGSAESDCLADFVADGSPPVSVVGLLGARDYAIRASVPALSVEIAAATAGE